jgi:hypothetical protein
LLIHPNKLQLETFPVLIISLPQTAIMANPTSAK